MLILAVFSLGLINWLEPKLPAYHHNYIMTPTETPVLLCSDANTTRFTKTVYSETNSTVLIQYNNSEVKQTQVHTKSFTLKTALTETKKMEQNYKTC